MSKGLWPLVASSATFTALWGQKCCHFDAVPQTEGCYMLLYLGSFCAVAVVCCQVDAGMLHTAMCQRMAGHEPLDWESDFC